MKFYGCLDKSALRYFLKSLEEKESSVFTNIVNVLMGDKEEDQTKVVQQLEAIRKNVSEKNPAALFLLGFCYQHGVGTNRDLKEAHNCYEMAQDESAFAQWGLGMLNVMKDPKISVNWFRKSADKGNALGQTMLGRMHTKFEPTEETLKIAVELFKKAEKEYSGAKRLMGDMYRQGFGVEKDLKEAVKWYRSAAELGDALAECCLGSMYLEGLGVDKDVKMAAEWFKRAAMQGQNDARMQLGNILITGNEIEKDVPAAWMWYQKAADAGNLDAKFNLGSMHQKGEGVEKDLNKAEILFLQAAKAGHVISQRFLGKMYFYSEAKKDLNASLKWFEKGAQAGDAESQNSIGQMYFFGMGVEKNLTLAFKWLEKSALQKYDRAQNFLAKMYYNGWGVEEDKKIAFELFQKAADQGNLASLTFLGLAYTEGLYVEKNTKTAQDFLKKASSQKHKAAIYILDIKHNDKLSAERERYKDLPIALLAAYEDKWEEFPELLLYLNGEQLHISLNEYTVLSLVCSKNLWTHAAFVLENLAKYPAHLRNLDAPLRSDPSGTSLHKAANAPQHNIVKALLTLGASIDKGRELKSVLKAFLHIDIVERIDAANAIFTLVEKACQDTARDIFKVEKEGESSLYNQLKTHLDFLGVEINARKKGLTALEVAIQNNHQQLIEALLIHGAELPPQKEGEITLVKIFRLQLEAEQHVRTFQKLIAAEECEKNAKRKNEEKLKQYQEKLNKEKEKIIKLADEILTFKETIKEPIKSHIYYKLGNLLHERQPHFKEMVKICLSAVTQDEEAYSKANHILFKLNIDAPILTVEKTATAGKSTGSLDDDSDNEEDKDKKKDKDNKVFLQQLMAGMNEFPPKEFAKHLYSKVFGDDAKTILESLGEEFTHQDVLELFFREYDKQMSDQPEKVETTENSDPQNKPVLNQFSAESNQRSEADRKALAQKMSLG